MRKNYWKECCLLLVGLILGNLCCKCSNPLSTKEITEKNDTIIIRDTVFVEIPKKLNKENVLAEIKKQGLHHPEIVLAQSLLETGNYKSKLCKTHNNLFGIRRKGKYVQYNHWTESITSYKKLIQSKYRLGEDYYAFIVRIKYAEDPSYISKIKKYVQQINRFN